MRFLVRWREGRGGTPLLSHGETEKTFDSYDEAEAFFNKELEETRYKKATPHADGEKLNLSQLELLGIGDGSPTVLSHAGDYLIPGSHFGSGRPFTGRTHSVTVYLTEEAAAILKSKKNKSAYIDDLIKRGEKS